MTKSDRHTEPVVALVVAAGSGVRLGGAVPKALRELAGVPLVVRAVGALLGGGCGHAVVVAPPLLVDDTRALFPDGTPVTVVGGGARRQDSVAAGLAAVLALGARIVLVHDAARPLVPPSVVGSVIEAVRAGAVAVVPVVPVSDSVRRVSDDGSEVVDRAPLRAVQTPQGFDVATLVAAHELVAARGIEVTDDAACCEHAGHRVVLVPGSPESLKITGPLDLVVAEAVLAARGEGACRG